MLKILSLDGGPGPLMQIRVIERLEERFLKEDKSFIEQVDLFAGTSDGGLMGLYFAKELSQRRRDLAAGRAAKTTLEIVRACEEFSNRYAAALAAHTQRIGQLLLPLGATRELALELSSAPHLRRDRIGGLLWKIAKLPLHLGGALGDLWAIRRTVLGLQPLAPSDDFERIMTEGFGDWTLGQLDKHVVILTFDTTAWKPRAYRNFGASDPDGQADLARDRDVKLSEVAMSTAAMPLFLPVYGGTGDRGYLDGIFSANNPCTSAVTLALRHLSENVVGNPLDQMLLLSMGVMQSTEEANIEHTGGFLALLDLLTVDDIHTRMAHSAPAGSLEAYLNDLKVRLEVFQNPKRKGIGERHWGWIEYLRRPTFIANMLIHGMNGEASAQTSRMLRGRFFRHAPRVCLARALFRTVFLGQQIKDTDLPDDAARCFGDRSNDPARAVTADEQKNVRETDALLRWLEDAWFARSIREVDEREGLEAARTSESFTVGASPTEADEAPAEARQGAHSPLPPVVEWGDEHDDAPVISMEIPT